MSRKFRLEIKCDNAAFEDEGCKCEVEGIYSEEEIEQLNARICAEDVFGNRTYEV